MSRTIKKKEYHLKSKAHRDDRETKTSIRNKIILSDLNEEVESK